MRNLLLVGLTLALAVAAGCSGAVRTPTPIPTTTRTPIPPPTDSRPVQEWVLQTVRVDGSTVTVPIVLLQRDVRATLDGREADRVEHSISPRPIVSFVFLSVAPGKHTVEVTDTFKYRETVVIEVLPP